jgi:hypothetical protein
MTRVELERLATAPRVSKVNPGNLTTVLASRLPGSTTVAATMFAAHGAGIRVFATGGIGGVHRGERIAGRMPHQGAITWIPGEPSPRDGRGRARSSETLRIASRNSEFSSASCTSPPA